MEVQWLRALTTLSEDTRLVTSTDLAGSNTLWPPQAPGTRVVRVYTHPADNRTGFKSLSSG